MYGVKYIDLVSLDATRPVHLKSWHRTLFFQKGAKSGFETCLDIGPKGLGCWGRNTSRIQNKGVNATLHLQADATRCGQQHDSRRYHDHGDGQGAACGTTPFSRAIYTYIYIYIYIICLLHPHFVLLWGCFRSQVCSSFWISCNILNFGKPVGIMRKQSIRRATSSTCLRLWFGVGRASRSLHAAGIGAGITCLRLWFDVSRAISSCS